MSDPLQIDIASITTKQRDDKMSGIMSDPTEQIVARKMGTMIKEHFGVEE